MCCVCVHHRIYTFYPVSQCIYRIHFTDALVSIAHKATTAHWWRRRRRATAAISGRCFSNEMKMRLLVGAPWRSLRAFNGLQVCSITRWINGLMCVPTAYTRQHHLRCSLLFVLFFSLPLWLLRSFYFFSSFEFMITIGFSIFRCGYITVVAAAASVVVVCFHVWLYHAIINWTKNTFNVHVEKRTCDFHFAFFLFIFAPSQCLRYSVHHIYYYYYCCIWNARLLRLKNVVRRILGTITHTYMGSSSITCSLNWTDEQTIVYFQANEIDWCMGFCCRPGVLPIRPTAVRWQLFFLTRIFISCRKFKCERQTFT